MGPESLNIGYLDPLGIVSTASPKLESLPWLLEGLTHSLSPLTPAVLGRRDSEVGWGVVFTIRGREDGWKDRSHNTLPARSYAHPEHGAP